MLATASKHILIASHRMLHNQNTQSIHRTCKDNDLAPYALPAHKPYIMCTFRVNPLHNLSWEPVCRTHRMHGTHTPYRDDNPHRNHAIHVFDQPGNQSIQNKLCNECVSILFGCVAQIQGNRPFVYAARKPRILMYPCKFNTVWSQHRNHRNTTIPHEDMADNDDTICIDYVNYFIVESKLLLDICMQRCFRHTQRISTFHKFLLRHVQKLPLVVAGPSLHLNRPCVVPSAKCADTLCTCPMQHP